MTAFVADENVDAQIISRLRRDGRDVVAVAELDPGIDDQRVLAIANEQSRVLITADHDFGELVFRLGRATRSAKGSGTTCTTSAGKLCK